MKKLYTLTFVFLAFIFADAQNLVTNPSFTNGLTGWTAGPIAGYTLPTVEINDGSDSNNSTKYTPTTTTGFYQEIPVIGGNKLEISFWYKSSGDNSDSRIWSNYKDASDVIVYQDAATVNDPLRSNNAYLPNATSWTQKTITVTSPTNATKLVLAVRAYGGSTVSFDQFSVVQTLLDVKQNEISRLNIYPNPVSKGTLYITSDSNDTKLVTIFDILGKQVLIANTSNNTVNVSSLKGGSYIIKINEEGKTETKKIIIE